MPVAPTIKDPGPPTKEGVAEPEASKPPTEAVATPPPTGKAPPSAVPPPSTRHPEATQVTPPPAADQPPKEKPAEDQSASAKSTVKPPPATPSKPEKSAEPLAATAEDPPRAAPTEAKSEPAASGPKPPPTVLLGLFLLEPDRIRLKPQVKTKLQQVLRPIGESIKPLTRACAAACRQAWRTSRQIAVAMASMTRRTAQRYHLPQRWRRLQGREEEASSPTPTDHTETSSKPEEIHVLPPETKVEAAGRRMIVALREIGAPDQSSSHSLGPSYPDRAPPPPRRPGFLRRKRLFLLTVALPTLLAALYFIFLASDIYVSESRFVVRAPNQQSTGALGSVLQGTSMGSFGRAQDDVYTISQYILSRDALQLLDEKIDLRASWGSHDVDRLRRFAPFGFNATREALFEYYPRRVAVVVDPSSGITSLTVSVFSAEQAFQINEILLGEAENLVNLLNDRARTDLIRFGENEVRAAEETAKAAARAVSDFRNSRAVVDPEKQTELHFAHISRLQEELMRTESQLTQLRVFAPESPHPPSLELRVSTLQNEIAKEMEKITGGEDSLASKAAEYERLALEREFADQQLASALASLELARNEAQRQQLYLETISRPNLPDGPLYPRRFRGILTTFVLGLIAWGILSMLLAGVREHQQ